MNMLLNPERPRFDSDLWSALLRPQPASAAGARNTAARELGAVISISAAPAARMRRGGPQRLGSRSLEAPRQARRPVRVRTCEQRVLSPWRHVCMRRSSCATTSRTWLTLHQVRMHAGTACCLRTHRVSSTTMKPSLAHTPSAACSLPGAHAHMRAAACFPRGALCVLHKSSCVCCSSSTTRRPSTARTSSGAHARTYAAA